MLDHVIVTVSNFARSIAFYQQALKPLGITDFHDYKGQDGHPDLKGFGNDGRFFFWLREGRPDPDTVHFGFVAKSHAEVNAFFVAAIAAGGREKTAPAAQLQYHPDYYATWVLDPDGHDVEVVNKTGQIDESLELAGSLQPKSGAGPSSVRSRLQGIRVGRESMARQDPGDPGAPRAVDRSQRVEAAAHLREIEPSQSSRAD